MRCSNQGLVYWMTEKDWQEAKSRILPPSCWGFGKRNRGLQPRLQLWPQYRTVGWAEASLSCGAEKTKGWRTFWLTKDLPNIWWLGGHFPHAQNNISMQLSQKLHHKVLYSYPNTNGDQADRYSAQTSYNIVRSWSEEKISDWAWHLLSPKDCCRFHSYHSLQKASKNIGTSEISSVKVPSFFKLWNWVFTNLMHTMVAVCHWTVPEAATKLGDPIGKSYPKLTKTCSQLWTRQQLKAASQNPSLFRFKHSYNRKDRV